MERLWKAPKLVFIAEYSGDLIIFAGEAPPNAKTSDPVWQITQYSYSGDNLISKRFPQNTDGNESSEFKFVWDDRGTYTYGA